VAATAPERPAGVPEGGFWNPEIGGWEVSRLSAKGVREGECLFYRRDGSLQSRCGFVAGVREGPFAMFHPDGSVSRQGTFSAGCAEGIVSAFPGVGVGSEPLRSCCVPPGAVRLDLLYEKGDIVQEIFYDTDGRPILSDGRPRPPRPSGVPDDAEYDEAGTQWARRRPELHRFWTEAGVLTSEIEYANGRQRVARTFDAAGRLAEACEFSPDGARHGAFMRRFAAETEGPYADPRIREERGTFDHGQSVGSWSFLDAAGLELRTVERGSPFAAGSEAGSPAFAPDGGQTAQRTGPATAEDWWALARALRAEGRVREGLCAAARAAARDGDRPALERTIAAAVVALAPALAAQRGEALEQSVEMKVWTILDALVGGADAASAFRALAAVLPGVSVAAADFVAASLLLAPERRATHLTRALVRLQRGDEEGARADLAVVAAESPDAAVMLVGQLQAVLRPFDSWPAREQLQVDPSLAELGAGLVRELDEVRAAIGVYATRIGHARAAVQALLGAGATPVWLPPDLSALLPGGPVALRREKVSVDLGPGDLGQDDLGPGETAEMTEVEINEELATDGLGVPALLNEAQADWGALSWLCWSVGLERVALPEAVAEPPLFAVAMKTIVTRCWRAQDRLKTGGLLARANGVPGFVWQGIDIDALPQHLAQAAAEEYLRARSVFLWLADPEAVSPFQADLRDD
jgi:antitoxin component YwqK of YwqJK toxin-antitoxin module